MKILYEKLFCEKLFCVFVCITIFFNGDFHASMPLTRAVMLDRHVLDNGTQGRPLVQVGSEKRVVATHTRGYSPRFTDNYKLERQIKVLATKVDDLPNTDLLAHIGCHVHIAVESEQPFS